MRRREFVGWAAGAMGGLAIKGARAFGADAASASAVSVRPLDATAYRRERRVAKLKYGNVAYIEQGSGKAALFLHGFPLNSFQWRGAIERLSAYRRCIAPDFLGLGFTEVAAGGSCAPRTQVLMLAALLDR